MLLTWADASKRFRSAHHPERVRRGASEWSLPCPPRDATLRSMGCLLALLALISPRLVLFLLWIFSDVLSRAFEQTGWTVFCAATPSEARTLAMSQPVDLMVTDVILPEMDGFQLAEQIVKAQPHVPVIFMSGYSENYLPVRVPISSPASILAKPFPFQTLLLRATHMIMRRPAAAAPAFVSH